MKMLLVLLALATPLFAQVAPPPGTVATPPVTPTAAKPKPLAAGDKKFVKDALDSMFYELELTGKTKDRMKVEATKTVSNTIKGDLDKVWAEVADLASKHDEKIPTVLAGGDKQKAEKLGKVKDKFDSEFLKLAGSEAGKLAKTFETAAKSAADPDIKKVANTWAPTLKDHVTKIDAAEKEAAKSK